LRTETPDTTQDMQIETKNINVTCPYFAGIIQTIPMFLSPDLERLLNVNREPRRR
jgi:hypothetical protein